MNFNLDKILRMKNTLAISIATMVAGLAFGEGVKYRGIFVNDEDWGLRPWAKKHFGEREQIGVGAYKEIFSLMKRYDINLIWPAMHEGGYEFSSRKENLDLAAEYGITVGTSHCEPMLRNNCYLEKSKKPFWNFAEHPDMITEYWTESVSKYGAYDVLWTIGIRGIHDGGMRGGRNLTEKIKILENVFATQFDLLSKYAKPGAPMLFCPYKEVLNIYNAGLNTKIPKGATILWTNDNFGYIRRLGGPQQEGYGGGVYWHCGYYGAPRSYLHVCTTPPAHMWWELVAKAWNNNARDVWMINAGDVFQAEPLIAALGAFGKAPDSFGPDAEEKILSSLADEIASDIKADASRKDFAGRLTKHLVELYTLGFNRKPEHMSGPWVSSLPPKAKASFKARYDSLLAEEDALEAMLTDKGKERYFRIFGYTARFLGETGRWFFKWEGNYGDEAKAAAKEYISLLNARWDAIEGGKLAGFFENPAGGKIAEMPCRWNSHMQWPWNEKDDGSFYTNYRPDEDIVWIDATAAKSSSAGANGGEWKKVAGLGTSGNAVALLPVKPGVGEGAVLEYSVKSAQGRKLVLQFLPDYELWPGVGLEVKVSVNGADPVKVEVPVHNSNLDAHTKARQALVMDNFVRAATGIELKDGDNLIRIIAVSPGVALDKIGAQAYTK